MPLLQFHLHFLMKQTSSKLLRKPKPCLLILCFRKKTNSGDSRLIEISRAKRYKRVPISKTQMTLRDLSVLTKLTLVDRIG